MSKLFKAPSYSLGTIPGVLSPGAKYLLCKYDHSLLWRAKANNEWSYTSAPPLFVHGLDRDNLTHFMFCACFLHVLQFFRYLTSNSD